MPESTGKNSVGVGLRQPVMILRASLSAVSSFFVCTPAPGKGRHILQYCTPRHEHHVRRVMGIAPQAKPARRRRSLFLDDTYARRDSRCSLYSVG